MRAGLSSIQQTLTPDAATVLNQSIAEARRRKHGQTTPLHVAATLLASPTGYLRQACIRSHPNSSHPLQCRALELCFSVALERLTTAQNSPGMDPPISNALMAALKRAQAHQRRGCPEQQQQPLLAVKVELEQLIVSILDDPSVSRVMREASFSSPAVKAAIEQTLISTSGNSGSSISNHNHVGFGGIQRIGMVPNSNSNSVQLSSNSIQLSQNPNRLGQFSPPNRNVYLNPMLGGGQRSDEVKKVLEIMGRGKKRNPVLVGDSEPDVVVRELLRKIQSKEAEFLRNVEVVSMEKWVLLDKSMIPAKIKEMGMLIESKVGSGVGVVLDLGDLKWLVEQAQPPGVSEMGRAAVAEMANLVARFGGDENNKLWLIGTATCETYLRCQVYHSTMENDWDLQAVPVASRSPLPGMFPRMLSKPVEPLTGMRPVQTTLVPTTLPSSPQPVSDNSESGQQFTFCPRCSENYEKEFARLAAIEKSFSAKQDASKPSLPQWLQKASDQSQGKDEGVLSKQKTQELQKKWKDTCLHLHPGFHQNNRPARPGAPALSMPARAGTPTLSMPARPCGAPGLSMPTRPGLPALSMASLYNPNLLSRPPFQPKLQTTKPLGEALQLNMNPVTSRPAEQISPLKTNLLTSQTEDRRNTPPGSPVGTDLVLGRKDTPERPKENQAKDFLSCISSEPQTRLLEKFANALDADTYKKLLKGLMEKAWWQVEAATAIASAVTKCTLGNGKRRGGGSRGDVWLLFTGPDRVGKRKMASVLADQICGSSPVMIGLGSKRDDEESDMSFRGRTAIDRIAEAVRRNPFSVIMLEDIDEADVLMRGNIKRTIERGKLTDTHGREVGLGNAVFILTGDWSMTNAEGLRDGQFVDERKLSDVASGDWHLGLIVREKNAKRRVHWLHDEERSPKVRREMGSGLSLDLNLTTGVLDSEHGRMEGSHSSSDLTIDHDDDLGPVNQHFSVTSVPHDLADSVDDSIVFKPVNANFVRREIKKTISVKFSMVVDENLTIEVGDDVLEKIMGGLWHDRTSLEQWIVNVLEPSFEELKPRLPAGDRSNSVVRLVVESDSSNRGKGLQGNANWLPSSILV